MSILNKSATCDCGAGKQWNRQWCEDCFECLTLHERNLWIRHVAELARVAEALQRKISDRNPTQETTV